MALEEVAEELKFDKSPYRCPGSGGMEFVPGPKPQGGPTAQSNEGTKVNVASGPQYIDQRGYTFNLGDDDDDDITVSRPKTEVSTYLSFRLFVQIPPYFSYRSLTLNAPSCRKSMPTVKSIRISSTRS